MLKYKIHDEDPHFSQIHPFESRKATADQLAKLNPNFVPIIVERVDTDTRSPLIQKKQFTLKHVSVPFYVSFSLCSFSFFSFLSLFAVNSKKKQFTF